jgi:hypothetical protein
MGPKPDGLRGNEWSLHGLSEALAKTGEALSGDPIGMGTSCLTELQVLLEGAVSASEDAQLRFILFFLSLFIDDIKYNFIGDFPFCDSAGEGFHLRDKFLRELGETLAQISGELAASNYGAYTALAARIASRYLETITAMNAKYPMAGKDDRHVS